MSNYKYFLVQRYFILKWAIVKKTVKYTSKQRFISLKIGVINRYFLFNIIKIQSSYHLKSIKNKKKEKSKGNNFP